MMLSYQLIFYTVLMTSTLLSICSSTWFMVWVGMEMNTMMFVTMISQKSKLSAESALKYFMIQALSSILFLLSSLYNYYSNTSYVSSPTSMMVHSLMEMALLIKLGAAPVHFWLPQMVEGLTWSTTTIVLTWQKIIPLVIIMNMKHTPLIFTSSVMSVLVGTVGGLNQLSLKKMLSYSSISHVGWLLSASIMSSVLTMTYFSIYLMTVLAMISIVSSCNASHMSQTMLSKNNTLFMLSLFSLGGLPPLLGFIPKWMTLNLLITHSYTFLTFTLLMSAVISLVYYIRIVYPTMMMKPLSTKWSIKNPVISKTSIIIIIMNLCSFPVWTLMT